VTPLHWNRTQRWLRGHVVCHVDEAGSRFALTFDDGPSPRNTAALLEVLGRHGARATFFVLRGPLRKHPDLARRIVEGGHEIAVHGDWHLPTYMVSRGWLARDLERSVRSLRDLLGIAPRHYRAPFGVLFPGHAAVVRACGLVPVLGDVYPRDHSFKKPEPIVRRVLERLGPGSIVILHDSSALWDASRASTIAAVDRILEEASRGGLRSVTLTELSGAGP
jgi:peptidoglycan-N-acetylglucosamine deacetylase